MGLVMQSPEMTGSCASISPALPKRCRLGRLWPAQQCAVLFRMFGWSMRSKDEGGI